MPKPDNNSAVFFLRSKVCHHGVDSGDWGQVYYCDADASDPVWGNPSMLGRLGRAAEDGAILKVTVELVEPGQVKPNIWKKPTSRKDRDGWKHWKALVALAKSYNRTLGRKKTS